MYGALGFIPSTAYTGCAYNPSTGEMEAGGLGVLDQSVLGNDLGESLGYMTLSKDDEKEEGERKSGSTKTMMDWEDTRHSQVCQETHATLPSQPESRMAAT